MKKAFTLLELLIVVIIIAILATLAIPRFTKTTKKAEAAEALQILSSLRGAAERYKLMNGTNGYANMTLDNLDVDNPNSGTRKFDYCTANIAAGTFTFIAVPTTAACGVAAANRITIDETGDVDGEGDYGGI